MANSCIPKPPEVAELLDPIVSPGESGVYNDELASAFVGAEGVDEEAAAAKRANSAWQPQLSGDDRPTTFVQNP